METTNELNKQTIADPKDIGQELDELELHKKNESETPFDYKEFCELNYNGVVLKLGSCCMNAGVLADIIYQFYNNLKDGKEKEKNNYIG